MPAGSLGSADQGDALARLSRRPPDGARVDNLRPGYNCDRAAQRLR
jgi:hypothetical protein